MIDNLIKIINVFDIFFIIILIYFILQCFIKGFSLSLISFMKWVLSVVLTIIMVPKLDNCRSEYIEIRFINIIGLGTSNFYHNSFSNGGCW